MGDKKQEDWSFERLRKVHQKMLKGHRVTQTKLNERVDLAKYRHKIAVKIARDYRSKWWESMKEANKLKKEVEELKNRTRPRCALHSNPFCAHFHHPECVPILRTG